MKYYLLAMHQPVGDPPPPEILEPVMRDLDAVREDIQAAGVWVFGGGLHGPEAFTVLRMRDGEVFTTDGPYAEGKEHLGGFVIIKAPDQDAFAAAVERWPRAGPPPSPAGWIITTAATKRSTACARRPSATTATPRRRWRPRREPR